MAPQTENVKCTTSSTFYQLIIINAVSADMALEQSINRSAKSTSGIIGQTKCLQYVTEWQLIYHETLDIGNAFRQLRHSNTTKTELYMHRDLSTFKVLQKNDAVSYLKAFITERGNPFQNKETDLKNFSNQIQSSSFVALRVLSVFGEGKARVNKLHQSVYINRSSLYHDRLTLNNLPHIDSVVGNSSTKTTELTSKKAAALTEKALKTFSIAKEKCGSLEQIAKYDITQSALFDGNKMSAVTNKSDLMVSLEKLLTADDYTFKKSPEESSSTSLIIDFMSFTRGFGSTINHNNYKNFEEVLNHLVCNSTSICAHRAVHYIFYSYCEPSLKASERNRRHTSIITLARIDSRTPIPVQMDKFWGCNANKVKFQHYASDYIINNFHQISESDVIVSGIIDNENLTPAKHISCGNSVIEIPALQLKIEEADMRLIPHAYWLLSWSSKIVVVSNDTDVICLLLYYAEEIFNKGMEQLWLHVGVSASREGLYQFIF